jgi:hypothetical protein
MPIHISLDYTTPFQVGDEVFTAYPPSGESIGGLTSYPSFKGTISVIKLVFNLGPSNSCTITEPISETELSVGKVIYTIVPAPPSHHSAFTVECDATPGSVPRLFLSEGELIEYQQQDQ